MSLLGNEDARAHLHTYNLRGYCWCGWHRDDWARDENMLERIGEAFRKLNDETSKSTRGDSHE